MGLNSAYNGFLMIVALVLASGRGHRMGGDRPKQYHIIAGKPLLQWTLESLCFKEISKIQPVIHPEDQPLYATLPSLGQTCLPPIFGGTERFESVFLGLKALAPLNPTYVLIHDGARPCVSHELMKRLLDSIGHKGVIPALALNDTLRRRTPDGHMEDVDRTQLYRIQTPQAFPFSPLLEAYERFMQEKPFSPTDDAGIFTWAGQEVTYVDGCPLNVKATTQDDLVFFEHVLGKN